MRFKTRSHSSLFRKRKKGIQWNSCHSISMTQEAFYMIQYQSTQYTFKLYNRHYKHSDNFKEIMFGKLKKATSPHHWLGILRKGASKIGQKWIQAISVSTRNAQQKRTRCLTTVFSYFSMLIKDPLVKKRKIHWLSMTFRFRSWTFHPVW